MTPDKLTELDALIDAVVEGVATESDYARLDALLDGNADAQSRYLRRLDTHNALRWHIASETTRAAIGTLRDAGFDPTPARRAADRSRVVATIGGPSAMWYAAAAVVLFAALLSLSLRSADSTTSPPPVVATTDPQTPAPPEPADIAVDVSQPKSRVVERPIATLREPTGDVFAGEHTLAADAPIGVESIRIESGAARLEFADAASLSVQAPAVIDLRAARRVTVLRGRAVLVTSGTAGGFTLDTPVASFVDAGTEFGIDVDEHGGVKAGVFRGEVVAEVVDRYVGIPQRVTLTRDDGVSVTPAGQVTTAIIGDVARFAALRHTAGDRLPAVANAGFEYPRTDSFTKLAASGWTLMSHPVANADGMRVSAGVVGAQRVSLDTDGTTPDAPEGRQWAYLNAETFADGRTAHSSMHQRVGEVAENATYELRVTVGLPAGARRAQGPLYTIGLYTGTRESGPDLPLQVWRTPVVPKPGGVAHAKLRFDSPLHTPFRGQSLFIVIEAVPGPERGTRQVLVDDVRLVLLNAHDVARAATR